jgi:hypothetical protein
MRDDDILERTMGDQGADLILGRRESRQRTLDKQNDEHHVDETA